MPYPNVAGGTYFCSTEFSRSANPEVMVVTAAVNAASSFTLCDTISSLD